MYFIYSPYLGSLLQTRSQKGTITTLVANKERDPTKRLLSRSTVTTVKRLDDYLFINFFSNVLNIFQLIFPYRDLFINICF